MYLIRNACSFTVFASLALANPVVPPPPSWDSLAPVFASAPQSEPLPISSGNWIVRYNDGQWTMEVAADGAIVETDPLPRFALRTGAPDAAPVPEPATWLAMAGGLAAFVAVHLRRRTR